MNTIEIQGNTIEEIIKQFKKEYNFKDWEIQYEVIQHASNGFWGIRKKQATLRFTLYTIEERIKRYIEQLLGHLGLTFETINVISEGKTIYVTINKSSNTGFLIGKNGKMLEQLQYLVNRVFEHVTDLERIYLDTDDYRYRQELTFIRPYLPLFNKVKKTGKSITLEPMNAAERRIIHRHIETEKALKTMTVGEGEKKRIVIMPSGLVDISDKKRTRKKNLKTHPDDYTPEKHAADSYKKHNKTNPRSQSAHKPQKNNSKG